MLNLFVDIVGHLFFTSTTPMLARVFLVIFVVICLILASLLMSSDNSTSDQSDWVVSAKLSYILSVLCMKIGESAI